MAIAQPAAAGSRNILDLMADALHERTALRVLGGGEQRWTGPELWSASGAAANWFRHRAGGAGSVAAVLDTSLASVACVLGAWRAGVRLGSLPVPGRGVEATAYRDTVRSLCRVLDTRVLVTSPETIGLLDGLGVDVVPHDACLGGAPPGGSSGEASFVQFSSGTTARPKGIELTLEALGSNVDAMLAVLAHDDPVTCSWLPLSHDLGLVGMVLTSLAAGQPQLSGNAEVILMPPGAFLARPSAFLRTCAESRVSCVAMPSFGMELLARRPPTRRLDLSRLGICIVGAEPIRAEAVRAFTDCMQPHGLDPLAICPAYGLAEATVGVTLVEPSEHWRSVRVSSDGLSDGVWEEVTDSRPGSSAVTELVCVGKPLPNVALRVEDSADGVGPLSVRSPSVLKRYLDGPRPVDDDGWLRTNDLAHVGEEGAYVTGRADDLIFVAGRNLYASALEHVIDMCDAVRPHAGTAIPDDRGRYVIVAERRRGARVAATLPEAAGDLRRALARRFGVGPSAILFLRPGSFPRTTSGKLQRNLVARRYRKLELDPEFEYRFGARS